MSRRSGFTLLETLAVVVGLSLVLTAVVSTYVAIQDQSVAAARATEAPRRATALLDQLARELGSATLLVKPDDVDPAAHPWLFLGERRVGSEGSDRIRFQTRSGRARTSSQHQSDLRDVAVWLAPSSGGAGNDLYRWSSSQLPSQLERRFPRADQAGAEVWARGIETFGVRWLAEDGAWVDEWDSSTLAQSSQLPVAAEISVSFIADADDASQAPLSYARRLPLVVRPLDLQAALAGDQAFAPDPDDAEGQEDIDGNIPDEEAPEAGPAASALRPSQSDGQPLFRELRQ